MRLEAIGLPGSGKTTLAKGCRSALRAAGHAIVDPTALDQIDASYPPGSQGLWRLGTFRQSYHIAQYLSDYPHMHQFFQTHYAENIRNIGLSLSVGADLSRASLQAEHFDYVFVDEGFLHLGSHAILKHANWDFTGCTEGLEAFLDSLPRPDAVLYPQASVETATKGIFARLEGQSDAKANRRFNNAFGGASGMQARFQLIEAIVERLQQMGVPVITVEAHAPLDTLVDAALTELRAISA